MLKLVINRKQWLHGTKYAGVAGVNASLLHTSWLRASSDKKQCCLGFLARAEGFLANEIEEKVSPQDLDSFLVLKSKYLSKLVDTNGYKETTDNLLCEKLMQTNDKPGVKLSVREGRIKKLMREIGVAVKFV